MEEPRFKRVLLKISGEALAGDKHFGLDFQVMARVADVIKECVDMGVQVGVVIGGGNFWRGRTSGKMDRTRADHMGMLATAINALALQDSFQHAGLDTVVMTAVEMDAYADRYNARAANRLLSEGKIVIFGCGMGVPYFSTDTAAVLRAAEIGADALLMAKNVDYLYTADPRKDPDAKPIHDITYTEILEKNLRAFDMTAVSFCNENGIEAYGFALADPENIYRVVMGQPVGTRMHT